MEALVHWFYPSTAVGCGGDVDDRDLSSTELTSLRSKVTCPSCLEQLRMDEAICQACKLGAPERIPLHLAPPHVCDPTLA